VLLAAGLARTCQAVAESGVGVDEAIAFFSRAFDIADDAGHIQRVLVQLDLLDAADASGAVRSVRDAVIRRREARGGLKSPRP
jgi:hypothetical protein